MVSECCSVVVDEVTISGVVGISSVWAPVVSSLKGSSDVIGS